MLVIGHRGAAGLAPENTMEALRAGFEAGADMLEFDIRLTKDKIPVVIHDARLLRTHHDRATLSALTLAELRRRTQDAPIPTLEEVLDAFFGKILLNIEIKSRGAGRIVAEMVAHRAKRSQKKWDNVLFSSFRGIELIAVRRTSPQANLAVLHDNNPFVYIAYLRPLRLTAVGFHRLHTNRLAHEIAKKAGLFTYIYTVNRPKAALLLARQGYDGVVTNYPDRMNAALEKGGS